MQAYFARHGQTSYNLEQRCNDNPERPVFLTPEGRTQAQGLAEALENVPLERIFVSELPRTRQTAEIVNARHRVAIESCALLNDIRTGCDGRPVREYMQAIAADPLRTRVRDGETLLEHRQRVLGFLDLLRQRRHETVLVIAHEETLRVFWAWYHGIPDREMPALQFGNCEYFPCTLPP